jgi:hypothetical protein
MKKSLFVFIAICLTLGPLSLRAQENLNSLRERYNNMPTPALKNELASLEDQSEILMEREKLLNDYMLGKYQIFPRYHNKMIVGGIITIAGSAIILPLIHKDGEALVGLIRGMMGATAGAAITATGVAAKLFYKTDTPTFLAELDAVKDKKDLLAMRKFILEEKANNYTKRLLIQERFISSQK